jgi:potassium efflux system protein
LIIIRFSIPEAPTVFFRVIGVLLLIPMLRLLPLYLPRFYRRAFYVLSGLYLLHRVEALSIDMPILYRLLLLLLTVSAVASIAWFERSLFRHKSDPDVPRRFWHAVVSRGAGTLLMVSLGANIVGAVALSEMLTEGTLNSLYSMLVLTAGVFVFSDLFDLILRTRVSQTLRMVKDAQEVLSLQWTKVLKFAAAVIWTILALSNFNLWIPAWSAVADLLAKEWTVGTWTFSFGSILALVLTIWISVQLSRLLRFALETDVLPRTNLRRGVQSTISSMAYYLALLSGLILATSMIGFKWDTIAIIIGALGVGIGFGLQNLVNNVVSGLILMFERPINVGDTIEFGGRFGDVLRIGLRASTVRTFDGSEVIVPNANLVSSEVVNWTLSDRNRRMEITVGVEYGSDPETVLSVLLRVVRQHPKVMQSPDPFAWFMGFGDSSLDFVVKFWCQFEDAYTARSEIMTSINHALREAGIVIPFPQRDLHVRSVDPRIQESLSPRKDSNR